MKQPIRLLLIIPHLGGGGAERVAAELALRLNRERFNISFALITEDGPGAQSPPAWIKIRRFHVHRVRQAWLKLARLVRAKKPDVILSGMAHLNFLILFLKPLLPRKTRIIVRQNSTASASSRNALDRLFYRRLYPRADAIICQSQAMADDLADSFHITRDRLIVLANPIDIAAIRSKTKLATAAINGNGKPSHPPEYRLLTIARLSHEKGIDLLLDALAIIKQNHPHITLSILGVGPEEANLRRQCMNLSLESQVAFRGFVTDPSAEFSQAHLFVLPSRHEGMPNALLEAAAAGLPIAATPSSAGVINLLCNQPGTWLATSLSADALAQTISNALVSLGTTQRRFDHAFLAPFESTSAIAAYEALISRIAHEDNR